MNKEQQELSEGAACLHGWYRPECSSCNPNANNFEPDKVRRVRLHVDAAYWVRDEDYDALLALHKASLSRERELQATNNALTRVCAAQISKIAESESQLLAKDALIASLNEQIKGYRMAYDYDHDCDEQLYVELGVPLCDIHQRYCWAHVACWLVENKKSQESTIASLKAEISRQNKAEDELLATGEKLAEERK